MRFEPNEDQTAFLSALEQMAQSREANWKISPEFARFDWSAGFDATLSQSGFLDCAAEETLGLVAATAMTFRLARLPVAVECAASALLRPLYASALPRPLAVIDGDATRAVRFLPIAKSVIAISGDGVRAAILDAQAVEPVESLFAFPMGVLKSSELRWISINADVEAVRDTWRIAIAAEIAGALKGGLDAVVAHVRDRRQFGRPIGSFQAVQHRLAGAAAKIDAAYWLALKAAQGLRSADAATALGYVQEASTKVIYDLHQFMGAMGLTLEHPLHRFTYRARLLRSALGGASANMRIVSERLWRAA